MSYANFSYFCLEACNASIDFNGNEIISSPSNLPWKLLHLVNKTYTHLIVSLTVIVTQRHDVASTKAIPQDKHIKAKEV